MNKVVFHDTHIYPGCLATFYFRVTPSNSTVSIMVEFTDGVTTDAEIGHLEPEELFINVDSYITAGGTRINNKSWRLRFDSEQAVWKVIAKI
jgi:hypothetical protein